jgi:phosphoglycerate dehydrogenase-like enzyme
MTDAVADYCFALLLGLVRRIPEGDACMRRGGWEEYPGVELRGKRLGLIGFGKIGQEVARRAFGFGLEVVTHDPNWNPELEAIGSSMAAGNSVRSVDLETLLRTSRFVSLHAPNIPQTRHLINAQRLSLMRPDAYLINTSRGALIDEQALREALLEGRIAGAAIDVYQQEPLPADHPLRQTPRLLLTPHNAFNAREAAERMSEGCALPILDLLQGRRPQFVCNPDGWEPCMSKTSLSGGVIGCE